jgi:DNA-directed RNA polymerase specialized sigma24 family protein
VQETLLRIWQVAPRFVADGQPNGLLRLAVRIARNLAVSERRRARTQAIDPAALDEQQALTVASADPLLRGVIELCRRQLEGKPAAVLEARLAGGESDEALAARLSMRLNTFLQNFTRARRFLAECLRRRGVDLELEQM